MSPLRIASTLQLRRLHGQVPLQLATVELDHVRTLRIIWHIGESWTLGLMDSCAVNQPRVIRRMSYAAVVSVGIGRRH
jgi:hypothetical protein